MHLDSPAPRRSGETCASYQAIGLFEMPPGGMPEGRSRTTQDLHETNPNARMQTVRTETNNEAEPKRSKGSNSVITSEFFILSEKQRKTVAKVGAQELQRPERVQIESYRSTFRSYLGDVGFSQNRCISSVWTIKHLIHPFKKRVRAF